MSGNTIGGILGAGIGFLIGGPAGLQWGFAIGSMIGGVVDPQKIYGPKLQDASRQTAAEGVPLPFGYGTFTTAGHLIACTPAEEHERKEGGKGGPVQVTYYYTRTYAIAVCEGEATIQKIKRNGKLVYDISPTSEIAGKSAKFLRKCTIYTGSETQLPDPSLQAAFGTDEVPPYLGLCYIVMEDDECPNAAAVDQFEFVVQKCGTLTNLADARATFVMAMDSSGDSASATRTGTITAYSNNVPGGNALSFIAARLGVVVLMDSVDSIFRSTDNGVTYTLITNTVGTNRTYEDFIYGRYGFVFISRGTGADVGKSYKLTSTDGLVWVESEMTGIAGARRIQYGGGVYVLSTGIASGGTGMWTSTDLEDWTLVSSEKDFEALYYNAGIWMAVGGDGRTFTADAAAGTWTYKSAPLTGVSTFYALSGGPGYFVAYAGANLGVYRTVDNGATWTQILGTQYGTGTAAAKGRGVIAMAGNTKVLLSEDDGLTWSVNDVPGIPQTNDIAFVGPQFGWLDVPDAEGLYTDLEGNVVHDFVDDQYEISSCGATLGDIVADLCARAGVESTEYDVSQLTDFVKGFRCATESSAAGFIAPLGQFHLFDCGEWDKKLRFVKRGGASIASLTVDDLVERDGPPIEQEQVQEVELLRKVNVMTIDPAADYAITKQTWERRSGTVVARGESTIEIPIVATADATAQTAEILGKVAWSETDKLKYGLTLKWSKLTPTDVVTLTDRAGVVHRLRLNSTHEELGVLSVEEAIRDRASTYASSATGVVNPNLPVPTEGLAGPTLLTVMNLAQLRNQDSTPGVYLGAAGVLAGWPGCQILLSVDGGLSYTVALTITEATRMGTLTAGITSSGTPLSALVCGGALESKTTAQVATGANYSAVVTNDVAEVLAYEDATAMGGRVYDCTTLTRGLEGSVAADHFVDDAFVDLGTAYFLPIDQAHAGETLYFKAVAFGISADDVEPVSLVFEGSEYVEDGGEIT